MVYFKCICIYAICMYVHTNIHICMYVCTYLAFIAYCYVVSRYSQLNILRVIVKSWWMCVCGSPHILPFIVLPQLCIDRCNGTWNRLTVSHLSKLNAPKQKSRRENPSSAISNSAQFCSQHVSQPCLNIIFPVSLLRSGVVALCSARNCAFQLRQ